MITQPENKTPTFINVGPGRCATSWLLDALESHPDISMATVKETEFFNTHFNKPIDWYTRHFDSDACTTGEISTNYYLDEEVATRIFQYNPKIKLIFNLRDPYSLLQSFHGFGIRRGVDMGSLQASTAVSIGKVMGSGYDSRLKKNQLTTSDQRTLLDSVCIFDRLEPFAKIFSSDQIHFFVFERLENDFEGALRDLYRFIGVDDQFIPEGASEIVNSSIQPKSKFVARLATKTASCLRSVGAFGLLAKLHRSKLIKKLLFNKSESVPSHPRELLNDETCSRLDAQIARLIEVNPELQQWWKRELVS